MKHHTHRDAFSELHPLNNFLFYILVIAVTVSTLHPVIIGISLVMGLVYISHLKGKKGVITALKYGLPLIPVLMFANACVSHSGDTILFFVNGNRITLEAVIRGGMMALVIDAVVLWFYTLQAVMTEEKLIWLFSGWAPKVGLTISMILRYIPMLVRRYREVHMAELAMGHEGTNGFQRMRQSAREFSTVLSWSLETSIEKGDSMEARGYGILHGRKRTTYQRIRFTRADAGVLAIELAAGILGMAGVLSPAISAQSYPVYRISGLNPVLVLTMAALLLLTAMPLLLDRREERLWEM